MNQHRKSPIAIIIAGFFIFISVSFIRINLDAAQPVSSIFLANENNLDVTSRLNESTLSKSDNVMVEDSSDEENNSDEEVNSSSEDDLDKCDSDEEEIPPVVETKKRRVVRKKN